MCTLCRNNFWNNRWQKILNNSGIIGWFSGIIALNFTHFLAVSQLNSWRNIASNTASKNCAKRSLYSDRAVTYNQKYLCDCSKSILIFMHVLCLHVAIAAGDYPFSNFICYMQRWNMQHFLLQWAATAKSILTVQPYIFCCNLKGLSLVNPRFT